ncbi:hypothetical protein D3C87_1474600 [compost metagenome]
MKHLAYRSERDRQQPQADILQNFHQDAAHADRENPAPLRIPLDTGQDLDAAFAHRHHQHAVDAGSRGMLAYRGHDALETVGHCFQTIQVQQNTADVALVGDVR